MRITSGKARGISLKSPRGDATRPATDAARQALFSSLGDFVDGAVVYDVFAGTGSYGLEALSRGAKSAVFFERGREALACLRANIESVGRAVGGIDARVVPGDAFSGALPPGLPAPDLVFADPPYEVLLRDAASVLGLLRRFASGGGLVALEAPAEFELPGDCGFEVLRRLGKKGRGKPSQIVMRVAE